MQAYGIGKTPTDIHSLNPLLILLVETCDAHEQLALLLNKFCEEHSEFNPLVNVMFDCLNLDYRRRITAPALHEKFSVFLQ